MKKILVVVDMQNDFIDGALAAENGTAIVANVIDYVKQFDGQVLYTLDTHFENYLTTQEGSNLPVPHCVKGTNGWEIPDNLKDILSAKNAKGFEKPSFGSPELALYLAQENKKQEINEIELVGICTDICVLTNCITLKTFLPEVKITVLANMCAGVTAERHTVALEAMQYCQIKVK